MSRSVQAGNVVVTFDSGPHAFYNQSANNLVLGTIINPNPFQIIITTIQPDGTLFDLFFGTGDDVGYGVPIIPASTTYSGVVIDLMGCNVCNPPLPPFGTYSGNISFGWQKINSDRNGPPDFVSLATPLAISVQSNPG